MKSQFIKYTMVLGLVAALSSCSKDFLDIKPKGKLIAKNTNDYNLLLNNYNLLSVWTPTPVLGDEVTSIEPYFSGFGILSDKNFFMYADDAYLPSQNAFDLQTMLPPLYTCNKIINEVMGSDGGSQQQKLAIKAEALTHRAWYNFMFINFYGKPYSAASAATDPGFPIITVADINNSKFTRASVQQVYDFIIGDLQIAIQDLPKESAGRIRVPKAAAEALLGKVYIFMGKYNEALPLLNNAFADLPATYNVRLYNYNTTLAPGGAWNYDPTVMPLYWLYTYPTQANVEENLLVKEFQNSYTSMSNDILLKPQAAALYGASDQRLKLFSTKPFGGGADFSVPNVYRGAGMMMTQWGITLPDMYLLRAECKARTNDIAGAKADVEQLRMNRMPAGDATVNITDQTQMIKFIIDERTREFAMQGYRWFDMRRLSTDPIFSSAVYAHHVTATNGQVTTYPLKPERLTLRLSQNIIDANPGMQNNP